MGFEPTTLRDQATSFELCATVFNRENISRVSMGSRGLPLPSFDDKHGKTQPAKTD